MAQSHSPMSSRAAFAGLNGLPGHGHGIAIRECEGMGIASLRARKDKLMVLAQRLRERCGIELPSGPRRAVSGELSLLAIGPDSWIAIENGAGDALYSRLRDAAGDAAAVSDQSSAYGVLRLSGAGAHQILSRLLPIDLHASVFKVDDVASTLAGHIGVTLWRVPDEGAGCEPVFEIAVYRSLAESLWRSLVA